jgi:hypothetical protein
LKCLSEKRRSEMAARLGGEPGADLETRCARSHFRSHRGPELANGNPDPEC